MSDWADMVNTWASGWAAAMLRASWQGGAAILVVAAVIVARPGLSPEVRCLLWRLAFAKLVIALLWATPVDLPLVIARPAPQPGRESLAARNAPAARLTAPATSLSVASEAPLGARARSVGPSTPPAGSADPGARLPLPSLRPGGVRLPGASAPLFLLWLSGVLWCCRRMAWEWQAARRLRRLCAPVQDETLLLEVQRLVLAFGLHRVPRLLRAPGISSPMLLGGGEPAIVLPPCALHEPTPRELSLALAHELAHLKRRDLLWNWLPAAAASLFFFHPLVWLAHREARLAGEMAADALAVRITGTHPADYAVLLVRVAARCCAALYQRPAGIGSIGAADESLFTLKRRLYMLRQSSSSRLRRPRRALLAAGLGAGLLCVVPWRVTVEAAAGPGGGAFSEIQGRESLSPHPRPSTPPQASAPPQAPVSPQAPAASRPPVTPADPRKPDPAVAGTPARAGRADAALPVDEERRGADAILAEQWEEVLLLEATRYLRMTSAQLQQMLPLALGAETRLANLREEAQKTQAAIARIAQQNRRALLAGRPGARQSDALQLDRALRQRRAQAEEEIIQHGAPRLARILSHEQIARAYLLTLGEPVRDRDHATSAALLDPSAGFVVGAQPREQPREWHMVDEMRSRLEQRRADLVRKFLAGRYPLPVVEALLNQPRVVFIIDDRVFSRGRLKMGAGSYGDLSLDIHRENAEPVAVPGADSPVLAAARREMQALGTRQDQLARQMMEEATEEELASALRLLVRRMFLSPRLRPVLEARLQR